MKPWKLLWNITQFVLKLLRRNLVSTLIIVLIVTILVNPPKLLYEPAASTEIEPTVVSLKTSGYAIKTAYGGKTAPLEFNFTASSISDIVRSWRNHSGYMKWKIVDILQMPQPELDAAYKNPCFHQGLQLHCMPYYMVIGVAKCGTSELMHKISLHRDVQPILTKEMHWFDRGRLDGKLFSQYMEKFSIVQNHPKQHAQTAIMGDGTPDYFTDSTYWMDTPENVNFTCPEVLIPHLIHHLNPLTKLILIVRDPVERLYSDYKFFGKRTTSVYSPTPEDFHERVKYSTQWLTQCFSTLPRRHCLYDIPYRDRTGLPKFYTRGHYGHSVHRTRMGLYSEYLKDWYSVFPSEQILVISLEQYSANQTLVLNKVYIHLGLELSANSLSYKQNEPRNVNNWHFPPMLTKTRHLLQQFYRPFNKNLALILGDEQFLWRD